MQPMTSDCPSTIAANCFIGYQTKSLPVAMLKKGREKKKKHFQSQWWQTLVCECLSAIVNKRLWVREWASAGEFARFVGLKAYILSKSSLCRWDKCKKWTFDCVTFAHLRWHFRFLIVPASSTGCGKINERLGNWRRVVGAGSQE